MIKCTAVILFALAFSASATGLATVSEGNVKFAIDTAVFNIGAGDTLLLEIYQEEDIAQFSQDSDGMCLFTTEIALCSVQGDTLEWDIWNTAVQWSESGSAVNCKMMPVLEGDWVLVTRLTDVNNGMQGVAVKEFTVEVPGYLSDIEMARTVMPAAEGSVSSLLKGSLIVFPAASTTFSVPGESMFYTYQEVYALGGQDLMRYSRLLNSQGVPIFARPTENISIPVGMETIALLDSFDLSVVRDPGLYTLSITYSQNGDTLGTVSKPMIVEVNLPAVEATSVSENITDRNLTTFPVLLSNQELELYERLDEDGQALYYDNFWNARPGEHTDFLARNSVVSIRYQATGKQGWETDRGRVYIIHGDPDEMETNPFSTTLAPYEIWYYYGSEQDSFVFADLMGNGDYLQIFSTVEGEVSYSNWQSMLQNVNATGGVTGDDEEF